MNFSTKKTDVLANKTQCAVVFALNNHLLASAKTVDEDLGGSLSSLLKNKDLKTKSGSKRWIALPEGKRNFQRVLLVHLGQTIDKKALRISSDSILTTLQSMFNAIARSPVKEASLHIDDLIEAGVCIEQDNTPLGNKWLAEQLAVSAQKACYRYTETKTKPDDEPQLNKLTYVTSDSARAKQLRFALDRGNAIGAGIQLCRNLGNLPPNICTPSYLADLANSLSAKESKLNTKIISQKQMQKMGMGAFVSVAKGSSEEGKLIVMEYKGAAPSKAGPHVIVGKGITFDTGGISLKPGPQMDEMKFDMCGAASVFGVMQALVTLQAKVHVIGLVAAAENMPAGNASKPGDVVTSMSGQTIEILNTDAEGRLVLCDTLTYAERYKPKSVVDIATLTGACVIALGQHATALFSNNQALADKLLMAGQASNDKAWQMPLWDDYQKQLDSNFADMANIGGRAAGSVTAACFLSRFTKKYHWAHLDIAGTAWNSGYNKGATGRPVALLMNYLLNT